MNMSTVRPIVEQFVALCWLSAVKLWGRIPVPWLVSKALKEKLQVQVGKRV
jgi:hypothetical protein